MGKLYNIIIAFKPLAGNLVFRFLVGFPLGIAGLQLAGHFQNKHQVLFEKIALSAALFIVYYLIILSVLTLMFERVYSFHEENNSANLNKNPLKFAIKNRMSIFLVYKWSFNFAFIWLFIVVWFVK